VRLHEPQLLSGKQRLQEENAEIHADKAKGQEQLYEQL
jgi:hypothetical protein